MKYKQKKTKMYQYFKDRYSFTRGLVYSRLKVIEAKNYMRIRVFTPKHKPYTSDLSPD